MNVHAIPIQAAPTINDDAAAQLQDEIYSAKMMAEIAITLISETFDGQSHRTDYRVGKRRAEMLIFAASDAAKRLREIDESSEKLFFGQA